jgi:toxin ParE1/3/4
MDFKLSKQASQDIEDIYIYGFINFGESQADQYSTKLLKCFDLLCSNPEIGRLDSRVNPAVRRFNSESHVVFYDIEDGALFIVRILHRSVDFIQHLST